MKGAKNMQSLQRKTSKELMFVIIFMLLAIALIVWTYHCIGYNLDRVHPDEVEVRDWLIQKGARWSCWVEPKRHIKSVSFDGLDITKEELKRLTKLTKLRTLSLNDTNVTDEFIPYINELKSLEYLEIKGTKITSEGWYKLDVYGLTKKDTEVSDENSND